MTNYSQNNEQDTILQFFNGKVGGFLDIGAHDGIEYSNVRALAESGWNGMLVEPNPVTFVKLMALYGSQPQFQLVLGAVSDAEGVFQMVHESTREWAGTMIEACVVAHSIQIDSRYWVKAWTPSDLVSLASRVGMKFDFVNIDAEWADGPIVIQGTDLLKDTQLICVEKGRTHDMEALCREKGFGRLILNTPENLIFAR